MNTQEKKEYIRQACIRVNPAILDFAVGSLVKELRSKKVFAIHSIGGSVRRILNLIEEPPEYAIGVLAENCESIGRPIRLSDVLVAIENRKTSSSDGEVDYSSYGILFHIGKYADIGRNGFYSKCYYNLLKDSLDDQSEETISFIYELLK